MTRYDAVLNDLKDLEQQPNTFKAKLPAPMGAKAIGWLYCAEGSNIGAAFFI